MRSFWWRSINTVSSSATDVFCDFIFIACRKPAITNPKQWVMEFLKRLLSFLVCLFARIYFHSLGENIQASLIFFHSFIRIFVCAIYAFAHRNIRQILSKHVLPSLMEALFNVPAKSAYLNVVRSDKTQVPVNQVSLPVSHRPGATLSRVCALRFCLVFSEALRFCVVRRCALV